METTKVTVSISRAHKIAERLKALHQDVVSDVTSLSQEVTIPLRNPTIANRQVEQGMASAAKAMAKVEESHEIAMALSRVRNSVNAENVLNGVSERLALLEAVNRSIAVYSNLKANEERASWLFLTFDEALSYVPVSDVERHVNVSTMRGYSQVINDKLRQLKLEALKLSDEIASANAKQVTLELPTFIAELVVVQ